MVCVDQPLLCQIDYEMVGTQVRYVGGISHFLAGLGTGTEAAQDTFLVFVEGLVHKDDASSWRSTDATAGLRGMGVTHAQRISRCDDGLNSNTCRASIIRERGYHRAMAVLFWDKACPS